MVGRKQEAGASSQEVRERFIKAAADRKERRVAGGRVTGRSRREGGELDFEEVKTGSKCWKVEGGGS